MVDWIDGDGNIIGDGDFECWLAISAFLNNMTLDDADISGRVYDSDILLLKAAAKLCEEIGLYYRHG